VRYSGVNQRAVVADEISTIPALGFNGSPSIFVPHAREVALGLDYWIAPAIVWQTEVDFEVPHAGGTSLRSLAVLIAASHLCSACRIAVPGLQATEP
jgi:hypothetical protein